MRLAHMADTLRRRLTAGRLVLDRQEEELRELTASLPLFPGHTLELSDAKVELVETPAPRLVLSGALETKWSLPGLTHSVLRDGRVTMTVTPGEGDGPGTCASQLSGVFEAPGWTLPVSGNDVAGRSWHVTTSPGEKPALAVGAVSALIPEAGVEARLPDGFLQQVPQLGLVDCQLDFNPNEARRTRVTWVASAAEAWELLPRLGALDKTTLTLVLDYDARLQPQVEGSLASEVVLAGTRYRITVALGNVSSALVSVDAQSGGRPFDLTDLGALLGMQGELAPLQEGLSQLGLQGLQLTHLLMGVDLQDRTLFLAEIAVQVSLYDIALEAHLKYPELSLGGGLARGSSLELRKLARRFWPELTDLPELNVSRFSLEAMLREPRRITLETSLGGDWTFPVGKSSMGLTGLDLTLVWAASGVRSRLVGWTRIDTARCYASIELPSLAVFLGLQRGSELNLKSLLGALVPGELEVPASLPEVVISAFALEAAPRSGAFKLKGRAEARGEGAAVWIGRTSVALTALELTLEHAERTSGQLVTEFRVGEAPFRFELSLPGPTLSARLREGGTLDLTRTVEHLLPEEVSTPEGLPQVQFTQLQLDVRPAEHTFAFAARTRDMWTLPIGHGLSVGELSLTARADRVDGTVVPSGTFSGKLGLGSSDFTVSVELNRTKRQVTFKQGDMPLDVLGLLTGLVPTGSVALPAELPGLENLQLSGISGGFDLATQAYHFSGSASVGTLGLGVLTLSNAVGSVEFSGQGSSLDLLKLHVAASVSQELVPELHLHHVSLVLELKRPPGQGLQWHVGGELELSLFELPHLRLTADASNGHFAFSSVSSPPLSWKIPDVLELTFERLGLSLEQNARTKSYEWSFEGKGGLAVAALPQLRGTLGLYLQEQQKGFAFTADEGQQPLVVSLPLVPGDERFSVGGSLLLERFSLLKKQTWELSLTSAFAPRVPPPSRPDSEDPLDRSLKLLNDLVARPLTATLMASPNGVSLTASGLPLIPVPVPTLSGGQLVWDRMGKVGLETLTVRLGSTLSAGAILVLQLPEEINNVFGEEAGRPRFKLLNRELRLGLSIDTKAGLWLELDSSPLNLESSGCFKKELEEVQGLQREWTRFTLHDTSLRFGEFPDAKEPGKKWWHFDFGGFGEVRLLKPRLSFNGADFAASGGFDVVRDLRLPTAPVRWVLERAGMHAVAQALPDFISPLELHVLEDDPRAEGGKRFNAQAFVDTLKLLDHDLGLGLPVEELRPVVSLMAEQFNQLPAGLRDYLDVTLPKQFEFDFALTPGTGFGMKLDVRAPKNPLKFLVPTGVGFQGLTLRKLSFGETLGGNLLVADMDLEFDQFDLVATAVSLFLPSHLLEQFTNSRALQQKLIVKNVFWIIIYQTMVPIPIPVWFDEVGVRYYDLAGLNGQFSVCNNLADFNLGKLFRGLLNLYQELKAFFTQEDRLLPRDLFSRNGLNLGIHVKPGFVRMPKYLGGRLFGSEGELFRLGIDELLVPVANFLKKPDLGVLLAVIPLEYRNGAVGTNDPFTLGPFQLQAAWLFSTHQEFDTLALRRTEQPNDFMRYLFSGGEQRGSEFIQALRKVASEPSSGGPREGLILYAMGGVDIPGVSSAVNGFVGLLADREKGLLAQFRFEGNVGTLLTLDVGGQLAVVLQRTGADGKPSGDVSLAGHVALEVLGHKAVDASLAYSQGVFTFEDTLSLFPPGTGFRADARVSGRITRDALHIDGTADVVLPPLPATKATLAMSYQQVVLKVQWLEQEWALGLSRQGDHQYLLAARAARPIDLVPGWVKLSAADDEQVGPALALTGPSLPSLMLDGKVHVPKLSASGGGKVLLRPDVVDITFDALFLGRYQAHLAVHGTALDKPAAFSFSAALEGNLLGELAKAMHDTFAAMLANAKALTDQAEKIFNQEWERFKRLVSEGYNAVRAGILQSKSQIEQLIDTLDKHISGLLGLLKTNEQEIVLRKSIIQQLNQKAQSGLQFFIDALNTARTALEAKQRELARLDAWYNGLSDWDKFWNWGYYTATRGRLWLESQALPAVLFQVEQELRRARESVPFIAEGVDAILQQLDRVRNGFLDELERQKQLLVDYKKQLDHYNTLLLKKADELLREFGKSVDTTARDAAQKAFELARSGLQALTDANERIAQNHALVPFELDRLSVSGLLGADVGWVFEARADIWVNVFQPRRLATGYTLKVDFNDLPRTASELAHVLWDKRNEIQYDDWEARRREAAHALDSQYAELKALRERLGAQFGETTQKKILFDMNWMELVGFYEYAKDQVERFPVLAEVLWVVDKDIGPHLTQYLEVIRELATRDDETARMARAFARTQLEQLEQNYKKWFAKEYNLPLLA